MASSTPTTTPAIVVTSPHSGDTATSPLRVTGTADVFEATFQVEILDSNGTVLVHQTVHATSGTGTRGTFDTTLRFATQHPGPGSLLAYDLSAKDGSRQDLVRVPLNLAD